MWVVSIQLIYFLEFISVVCGIPGIVETVAGGGRPHKGQDNKCNDFQRSKDGVGFEARFNYPWGIAYDHLHHVLYVADCGCLDSEHKNDVIRKIDLDTQRVTTIAGSTQGFADDQGDEAHFHHIAGITVDPELELLYIADSGNNRIRVLYIANNKADTVAGLSLKGYMDNSGFSSRFNNPQSIALYRDEMSNRKLFVADTDNHAIRVIHLESDVTGEVRTLAGGNKGFKDGMKNNARFSFPSDLVIDSVGKYLYVSDHFNHAIRRIHIETGNVTTLTSDGFKVALNNHVLFHYPEGLVYDPERKLLYVAEFKKNLIKVVTMDGQVKLLAGEKKGSKDGIGRLARFFHPSGLTFDRKRKVLYVSDQNLENEFVKSLMELAHLLEMKKKVKKKDEISRMNNDQLQINKYNRNVQWGWMIAIGFLLILFGATVVRPCLRLLFKCKNGESQSTFHYIG